MGLHLQSNLFLAARVEENEGNVRELESIAHNCWNDKGKKYKYVNKCRLRISTKPSIILGVLRHKVVLGHSRFVGGLCDKVNCCQSCADGTRCESKVLLFSVSLSDGAGASVVIVLASRVAGGVASAW